MERKCGDIPIQAMIGDRKLATTHQEDLNPLVSFTLSIWFDIIKQLNLSTQIKKLRWVAYDTDFVPNSMDSRFKFWMNRGITAFCRLIQNNGLHQRSSTGGPRPPGGPRRYCSGSAKLFHLKHFSLFQKLKTSNRLHKHKHNVKIAFYSLKIILPMSLHAII